MIALSWFFLLFFFEGLAKIPSNFNHSLLYGLVPAIYFIEKAVKKEKVHFLEAKFIYLFIWFFISLLINYFFSVDKINTVEAILFYPIAFFILTISFNEQQKLKKILPSILIGLGLVFSLFSLFNSNPNTPYQFFYPLYPSHNHLGDFLGLVMITIFFLTVNNKLKLFLWFIFLPFFLFSFSRSAYLDLFLILILFFFKKKEKIRELKKILLLFIIFISLFFIFSQRQIRQISIIGPILTPVDQRLKFTPRDIFSGRFEYFNQGIKGFWEKPYFGWGAGNYLYSSNKYVSRPLQQVKSALNIFLTNLTELGIFGFVPYLFLISFLLYASFKNKDLYSLLALYLFLNFQTDYTFSINGFYFLLFLLFGLSLKVKKTKEKEILFPVFSLLLTIFIWLEITGQILVLLGNYNLARIFFPWQHRVWQGLVNQALEESKIDKAKQLAQQYENLSSISAPALDYLVNFYAKIKEKDKLLYLTKVFKNNWRYPPFAVVKNFYHIIKKFDGKEKADSFFFNFYPQFKESFYLSKIFEEEVYQFCRQEQIVACRFRYFTKPKPNSVEKTDKELPYQAVYTFNIDGLNERFNYPLKKPKGSFRILILGDSHAFGFLVDTKDNWAEKLEEMLNQQPPTAGYQKYEVINTAYHSYDLAYQIERFRVDGVKYKPDLVIWLNNNFYRLNEIFLPIVYRLEEELEANNKLNQYYQQGKYFPAWELAYEEYRQKIKDIDVDGLQIKYLNEFFNLYQGPVVFISFYDLSDEIEAFLTAKKVRILKLKEFSENKNDYYEKIDALSPFGHEHLAKTIFSFLQKEK